MIIEYLYEIVALIAFIVIVAAYLFIKVKKSDSPQSKDSAIQEINMHEASRKTEPQESEEEEIHNDDTILDGSEEGDFGIEETPDSSTPTAKKIQKRDVPQHDKITKQHFTEFHGVRLLVAEDNLINQKVIAGLLADSGIELVMANDGKEALDILAKDSNFLMILMDAHMPRIDGFEATRRVRANPQYDHILVVALSGDTAADDIKKMSDAGMQEQLEKPLRMDALYDVLYAYSGNQTQESSSEDGEYVEVFMSKELNGDKGLEICGGDEKFYMDILNEFVQSYSNSGVTLERLLKAQSFKEADKLLLDIIGNSANIGADALNASASNLKDALPDKIEKSYLTLVEEYQEHLGRLLKDIEEYKNI